MLYDVIIYFQNLQKISLGQMSQIKLEYKSMSEEKKRKYFHKMSVKQSPYVFGEFFALSTSL